MAFKKNDRVRHKNDDSKGVGTIQDVANGLATVKWDDGSTTFTRFKDLKSR